MSKEKKMIPELRFPEFVNEGEWDEIEFSNFCLNLSSGKDKNLPGGEFELYGSTGVIGRTAISSYSGNYILVARVGANAGLLNRAKGNFGVTDNTLVIDLKKDDSIDFIYYNLENIGLNNLVFGSGQPLITAGQLKCLITFAPKSEIEQQKIASCLSSLDEVISAHTQKLNLLKVHKKGLMQNLFPQLSELGFPGLMDDRISENDSKKILKSYNLKNQNSDNIPKYRFPEFKNDGEWEEKKLGEVCRMQAGKFVRASEISDQFTKDSYPCYGGNGLRGYTKSYTHSDTYSLIGRQGALCGNVTLAIGKFHATEHAVVVTPEKNTYNIWLFYVLELLNLNQYATGQAQPGLSVMNLEQVKLSVPKNPKEQQKIASCLSSLDDLITAQAEKIEQLKLHKKGLMQGLFPKINE